MLRCCVIKSLANFAFRRILDITLIKIASFATLLYSELLDSCLKNWDCFFLFEYNIKFYYDNMKLEFE